MHNLGGLAHPWCIQDEVRKNGKWLIMVSSSLFQLLATFFLGKCHPSECRISSGKVVIYRISLMIRGCQRYGLMNHLTSPSLNLVPVILHALYEMAHHLRGRARHPGSILLAHR